MRKIGRFKYDLRPMIGPMIYQKYVIITIKMMENLNYKYACVKSEIE